MCCLGSAALTKRGMATLVQSFGSLAAVAWHPQQPNGHLQPQRLLATHTALRSPQRHQTPHPPLFSIHGDLLLAQMDDSENAHFGLVMPSAIRPIESQTTCLHRSMNDAFPYTKRPLGVARHPRHVLQQRPRSSQMISLCATPPSTESAALRSQISPLLILLLVPVVWGTYGVSIKELYSQPNAPPELLTTTMNYAVSSTALFATSFLLKQGADAYSSDPRDVASASEPLNAGSSKFLDLLQGNDLRLSPALLGGLELGAYLFVGGLLQISGIRYTTASRAAFLIQLTTVIVPLLDALQRRTLPSKAVVGASTISLIGVTLLVTEQSGSLDAALGSGMRGDALVAAAALFYSLNVVRLSAIAPRVKPVELARAKEICRFSYALVSLVCTLAVAPEQAALASDFFSAVAAAPAAALPVAAIILWTGTAATAFPTWAMSFGQRSLSAGAANIIYTTQPLWAAVFSFCFLGETLGTQGLAGAAALTVALAMVTFESLEDAKEPAEERKSI